MPNPLKDFLQDLNLFNTGIQFSFAGQMVLVYSELLYSSRVDKDKFRP